MRTTKECGMCSGTGEVCYSSTNYGRCPQCEGKGVLPAEPSPEVAPMQEAGMCVHCGKPLKMSSTSGKYVWYVSEDGWCKFECPATKGLHSPVPAVAPRETQTELRDVAVEIVDAIHGYTMEYAPSPLVHREKYDLAEKILRARLERGR